MAAVMVLQSSSYSSQSSPLRTFLPSISRLIPSLLPSRSLSRGRPHEIGARLRDACSERRGPRRLLPPSRNRSLVVGSLLFLHLRLPSFVRSFIPSFLRGVEWRKKSPGGAAVAPHFSSPSERHAACVGCWDNHFALRAFALAGGGAFHLLFI